MKKLMLGAALLAIAVPLSAQSPDAKVAMTAQTEALKAFDWMNGEWRGAAIYRGPHGEHRLTQTERVGPLLGGSVRIVEGRGYLPDGSTGFNAMAVIHYDPVTKAYSLSSFAEGRKGVFPVKPVDGGFDWEIQAGPAIIRYQARNVDGKWVETGERVITGKAPVRFYEMVLERMGDSSWPAATAVPAR